jgi:hypothetical protein
VLKAGTVKVAEGALSGRGVDANVAAGGATAADTFCVAVTAPKGSADGKTWSYTKDGLAKGACA